MMFNVVVIFLVSGMKIYSCSLTVKSFFFWGLSNISCGDTSDDLGR